MERKRTQKLIYGKILYFAAEMSGIPIIPTTLSEIVGQKGQTSHTTNAWTQVRT
jgi:hypothetical protein